MESRKLIALVLIMAVLSSCASAAAPRPKGLPARFAAGSWTLDAEEFARGELDGLVIENGALRLLPDAQQGTYTSRVFDTGITFDTLQLSAFHFPLSTFNFQLSTFHARTSLDGETWTPWLALNADASDDSKDEAAGDYGPIVPVPAGRYLQLRLILLKGQISQISVDYVYAAAGPTLYQAKSAALAAQPEPGAPRPVIIPRAGWGANESMMTWKPHYRPVERVVIHHTVTPNNEENPAATVRAIYYFHAITRKWGDIGYNYLIDWQGNIYEGRYGGEQVVGGHARGYNEGSIGVALMGTFTNQDITPAMRAALVSLLAWISTRYGIDPLGESVVYGQTLPNIIGHRAVANTNCPGNVVYAQLNQVRAEAAEVVARHRGIAAVTATPAPTRPRPTPTRLQLTPTPIATQSDIMPTAAPTLTVIEATPTPALQPPTPTPTPVARLVVTGMEVWPPAPLADQPITFTVYVFNPGPSELTQVSVQVLFDSPEALQTNLAWQMDRLCAGQQATLVAAGQTIVGLNAGVHQLAVRAAARDDANRIVTGEWGPLVVGVMASERETRGGWRAVIERWSIALQQGWQILQGWLSP